MNRRRKKLPKFVQSNLGGLDLIATHLNAIPRWSKDHELYPIWEKIEGIIETMTDQPPSQEREKRGTTLLTQSHWSPNKRYPLPGMAIRSFNFHAKKNPVSLIISLQKSKAGVIEVSAGHEPASLMQSALWFLWRFYFQDKGWERLKRCPQCRHWFVDKTKNKKKDRCSPHCTWQWWSRDRRKKSNHHINRSETRERRVNHGSH